MIYLDNNATTQPDPAAISAASDAIANNYFNPSAAYGASKQIASKLEVARNAVASMLGATTGEVVFTSGGSESIATAFHAAIAYADRAQRPAIVVSAGEHPLVLSLAELYAEAGFELRIAPLKVTGELDLEAARALLDERVAFASFMAVNNETGVIYPWHELATLAQQHAIPLHIDAVQAVGKLPINLRAHPGVSFASIAAHKFHGIKGAGALFVRKGVRFAPLIPGGHQEKGRRAGTENVAGILAMGAAAALAQTRANDDVALQSIAKLRDEMQRELVLMHEAIAHASTVDCVSNTLSIAFPDVDAAAIIRALDQRGVAVSAGAACTTGSLAPSHVLLNMGVESAIARSTIRVSLSHHTQADEIEQAIAAIADALAELRRAKSAE